MKKIIVLPLLLLTSTAVFPSGFQANADSLLDAGIGSLEYTLAEGIHYCMNKMGKTVPYIGNKLAARILFRGMFATGLAIDQTAKPVSARCTNAVLKTITTPLVTEAIIHGTKYVLSKCLKYVIPSVQEHGKQFQNSHPYITKAATVYAEELLHANIGKILDDGIDGLTYGTDKNPLTNIASEIRKSEPRIIFFAFNYNL